MTDWKTFHTPPVESFIKTSSSSEQASNDRENYLDRNRCGVCFEKLEEGEQFDLRPVQTEEERIQNNGSKFTSVAVIVHRRCIDESYNNMARGE